MAEESNSLSLEERGLVCYSYDNLFSVQKRIRKISDVPIPFRQGISISQIFTFFAVVFVSFILYALIVAPTFRLIGVDPAWYIPVACIFGPPVLAAQRIVKPMPHGKSITGTLSSFARYCLDDPVHRRGLPVRTPRVPDDMSVAHWQREWVPSEQMSADDDALTLFSDKVTEERLRPTSSVVELQGWLDGQARAHLAEENEARQRKTSEKDAYVHHKRGQAKGVMPYSDETGVR